MPDYTFKERAVKTRKEYSCDWCAERIEKGVSAVRCAWVCDGRFGHGHRHLECFEAQQRLEAHYLVDGWAPGSFKRGSTEEL